MIKYDFHVHTCFCDGKDSPEQTVKTAIEKGFNAIGFSGHSHTPIDESYCMSLIETEKYFKEIFELKNKYGDKINIYCGLEFDFYSDSPIDKADYLILSNHYIIKNDKIITVDESKSVLLSAVNECFNGDFYLLAEEYYKNMSKFADMFSSGIVGHFDLLSKFNEGGDLFNEKDERYVNAWKNAANALVKRGFVFEINTGAIAKGYRTTPYPSYEILKYLNESGAKIIYSGDTHDSSLLGFGINECECAAKAAGFENPFLTLPILIKPYRI